MIRHPFVLFVYSAAMGILEAIVVVYLRKIYYPEGFRFPLVPLDPSILRAEIIREAMTLIMLATVAWMAAAGSWARLMAFLISFGTWDLAYYAGLKAFLHWPASLLTPDILFLIPRVWTGPVLAPALVALSWILAGLLLHRTRYCDLRLGWKSWGAGLLGCVLILYSFLRPVGPGGEPGFSWTWFGAGYAAGAVMLARAVRRARRVA